MAQQAIVTLTALTPGIVPPQRVLKLNPNCPFVAIGRASKSVTKGLISGTENAWVDNPVMSRDHAELVLKEEDMSILIRDIKSMHGTQVNDIKLTANVAHPIKVGDIVSFGAEVRRGLETFPPCRFEIGYDLVPWSRGFQCPDSSDVEDENMSDGEEQIIPVEKHSEISQQERPEPIDLTVDDLELELVCDFTGPQGLSAEESAADQKAMAQPVAEKGETGRLENPIVVEEYDSDNSLDDDFEETDQQECEGSEGSEGSEEESDEDSDKENYEESDEDGAIDSSVYDSDTSSIIADAPEFQANTTINSEGLHGHMFSDNKDIPVSDIRTTVSVMAEGIPLKEGKSLPSQIMDESPWIVKRTNHVEGGLFYDFGAAEASVSVSHENGPQTACDDSSRSNAVNSANVASVATEAPAAPILSSQGVSVDRQPSPSDAAMVKTVNVSLRSATPPGDVLITQTVNPSQIQNTPDQWNFSASQENGDRTGKLDFFQAREINRARVFNEETHSLTENGPARTKFFQLGHPYNPRPQMLGSNNVVSFQQEFNHQTPQSLQKKQQIAQQQALARQQALVHHCTLQRYMANQTIAQQHQINQQMIQQRGIMEAKRSAELTPKQPDKHGVSQAKPDTYPRVYVEQQLLQQPNILDSSQNQCASHQNSVAKQTQSSFIHHDRMHTISVSTGERVLDESRLRSLGEVAGSVPALDTVTPPSRSAVRINDIVEPSITEKATESLKRKAPEISDVPQEEIRVWASKDTSISTEETGISSDGALPEVHTVSQETPQDIEDSLPTDVVVGDGEGHLRKKLKKLCEAAGYITLGGTLGGVALFTALAASAPNYI